MNKSLSFSLATIATGALLLVPLAILAFIFYQLHVWMIAISENSGIDLPFGPFFDGLLIGLAALAALLGLCFFIGLLLRTSLGGDIGGWIDQTLEKHFPVLGMLRNLVMQVVGNEVQKFTPAEIDLYGTGCRQLGVLVEQLPDQRYVVFIPSAPAVTMGQIHLVPADAVTKLDAPVQEVVNAITQWGAGASAIYASTASVPESVKK